MISAIVLAAGQSKRMGRPKLLLPWEKGTILEQVVDSILASGVGEVVVVLGDRAPELKARLAASPVHMVLNPDYKEGIGSSIRCGVKVAREDARGLMIVLGDQPLITSAVVGQLLEAFKKGGRGIVLPAYRGVRGHPVILQARYRAELMALAGDVGARGVVAAHPDDVLEVEVSSAAVVQDIDNEQDYERQLPSGAKG